MPLVSKTFSEIITFTRASTGTYFNSAGTLTSAAIDEPRLDYNPSTLAAQGLLIEEQRSNLVLNSLLNGTSLSTQSVTVTAVAHTLSFYGTGTVTLSGASTAGPLTGSGAFPTRSSLTFTPTAGTLTLTVTGTVQYANLEIGAFATSFIPTAGVQATRAADVASVNTLSPWYNASEGTLYAEFSIPASTQSRAQATLGDGTANERIIISNNTSLAGTAFRVVDGGVDQCDISNSTSFANGAVAKVAGAYAVNNFATCQGGGAVSTDTSGTLPTVTTLFLGNNGVASYATSYLRRLTYYPRRLSDAELVSLTS